MASFNPANYKNLKLNIREGYNTYTEEGYCLPIIVGAVQEDIVECYRVKNGRERNELKTYVRSKIIDLYIKEERYSFENKIDWTKCSGLKKQIWTHFVNAYFNNDDGDEAMIKLTEKIKNNIPSEYGIWIGLYISEAMGDVFYGNNDPYINEMLYSIFDNFPSVYRGTVIGQNGFSLSPVPDGNLDDEGNLVEEFDPETVDVFMNMYDDISEHLMPKELKQSLMQTYKIPKFLERTFMEVWRGTMIFTRDIIVVSVFDDYDNEKGTVVLTHVPMGEHILTLILENENNLDINNEPNQIAMNIGTLYQHPEFSDAYERALSEAILEN